MSSTTGGRLRDGRERILKRVGNALKRKTPFPETTAKPLFKPVTNLVERFAAECEANITECVITANANETCSRLRTLLGEVPEGEVFVEDAAETRDLLRGCERPLKWSSEGAPSEQCRVTITRCEGLVALTGSVITSSGCGGRGASVVAPIHVVVARESQLLPDLESALALIQKKDLPGKNSFIGLITGCSRTGDIEKILVMGAHGPMRLIVLLELGS